MTGGMLVALYQTLPRKSLSIPWELEETTLLLGIQRDLSKRLSTWLLIGHPDTTPGLPNRLPVCTPSPLFTGGLSTSFLLGNGYYK